MVKHEQQTARSQWYGTAYNATEDDGSISSLKDMIAGMNIKNAKSLQAFSELSQSNHKTKSRNLQLEHAVQTLRAQLAQMQQHTVNATMQHPPLMTQQMIYHPLAQQQYILPPTQGYNSPPAQMQQQ